MRATSFLAFVFVGCANEEPPQGENPSPTDDCGPPLDFTASPIAQDTTFDCTVRFQEGDLNVQAGATLTLEPCTRLELGYGSRIFVRDSGRIVAVGTED